MNFSEAIRMAEQIRNHYGRLDVIAIGRFLPPEELDHEPERWGVSVRVDGGARLRVLWGRDELLVYSESRPQRTAASQRPKPTLEATGEPLLF